MPQMSGSQDGLYDYLTKDELINLMSCIHGYQSSENIQGTIYRINLVNERLGGYCIFAGLQQGGRCLSLMFMLSDSSITLQQVNDWNSRNKYSKSYIDANGNTRLESEIMLEWGAYYGAMANFCTLFPEFVQMFLEHLYAQV